MSVAEKEGRYLIELVRSILMDEELKNSNTEHNWNVVYYLARRHSLVTMVYDALKKNNIALPEKLNAQFYEAYCKAFAKEGIFQHEYECIVNEFQKAGVHMVPLKGCIMKKYYPKPWYRSMSDMDILIRPEDCESVKACMERMGYDVEYYGDVSNNRHLCHDIYFKQPVVNVEIHHRLFEDIYPLWDDFFQNLKFQKAQDGTYCMTNEDTYVYLLTHTAKHLKNGGVGIRQILDLWLYWCKTELDKTYIQDVLKKLDLNNFHNNVQKLGQYWLLSSGESDERLEKLTEFFTQNEVYGSKENRLINEVNKANGKSPRQQKISVILSNFFPSMEKLTNIYPILKKYPILLPAIQIKRAFAFTFFKKSRIYVKRVTDVEEDKVKTFKWYMDELFERDNVNLK